MNTRVSVLLFSCLQLLAPVVGAGNVLPQVKVPTSIEVTTGNTLNVPLTVKDPDGDIPAVLLLTRPEGMALIRWSEDQLLLTWRPGIIDVGEHRIVLLLEDARDRAIVVRHEMRVIVRDRVAYQSR